MTMQKELPTSPMRPTHFSELASTTVLDADRCATAEARICRAIAALGRQAGIDVDRGEGPEDIDAALIQAAYECHFDDPQFLGGPGCCRVAYESGNVAVLAARTGNVTRGLLRYLRRRASPDTLREAQACIAAVEDALQSLERTPGGH